jgi:hypothetical protein
VAVWGGEATLLAVLGPVGLFVIVAVPDRGPSRTYAAFVLQA